MGFFSTDIELLPTARFDAGIDRWNALYENLKKSLNQTYGTKGQLPSKRGAAPAVPYGVAVGIAMQFAIELSKLIVTFISQSDDNMLVPNAFVKNGVFPGVLDNWNKPGFERPSSWWTKWDSLDEDGRRAVAMEWLRGEVVRPNYERYPNDKELKAPAYQHLLDANFRLMLNQAEGGVNIVIQTREDAEPERHWLRPAVRAYQNLIWLAYDLHSLKEGGPVAELTIYGADLFLRRIRDATTWLAIRIPSLGASDVWNFVTARTSQVIEEAAGTAANALDWATKTAAGAVNKAVGELDIFTWLVIGAVGAVFLALR